MGEVINFLTGELIEPGEIAKLAKDQSDIFNPGNFVAGERRLEAISSGELDPAEYEHIDPANVLEALRKNSHSGSDDGASL